MKEQAERVFILLIVGTALLAAGCAKKDLIIDYGDGDSIRLVDGADNFECDDPRYAAVKKVPTWTLQFADGTARYLCAPEETARQPPPAAPSGFRGPTASPRPTPPLPPTPGGPVDVHLGPR